MKRATAVVVADLLRLCAASMFLVILASCGEEPSPTFEWLASYGEKQDVLESREAILAMISEHDPVNAFPKDATQPFLSIHLQKRLLTEGGRPVFFFGTINDIFMRGEEYVVRFDSPPLQSSHFPVVHFELTCSADHVAELTRDTGYSNWLFYSLQPFAVVARVNEVRKYVHVLKPYPEDEFAYIEVEPSRAFLVTGECLGLVRAVLPSSEEFSTIREGMDFLRTPPPTVEDVFQEILGEAETDDQSRGPSPN